MSQLDDAYFNDLDGGKAGYKASDRPRRGCLFYGCISVLALGTVALVLLAVLSVFTYRIVSRGVEQYTATAPEPVPVVELPEEQITAIEKRIETFQEAADQGDATTLRFSAEELNALISQNPNLRGRLAVNIEGDQLQGQLSFPLEDLGLPRILFGGLKGRYLNGEARFTPYVREDGKVAVRIEELIVKGEPVPEDFMEALRQEDMVLDLDDDRPSERHDFMKRIEAVEIVDGELVIRTRASEQVPRPDPGDSEPDSEVDPIPADSEPDTPAEAGDVQ